jgi:hypothetical protein
MQQNGDESYVFGCGVSTDWCILTPGRGAYALSYTIEYAYDLGIREGDVYLQ